MISSDINIEDNNYNIKLINKFSNKSSYGVLSKGWYLINGERYLVKANSLTENGKRRFEPYSEVMTYLIGKHLGFNVIEYKLMDARLFPDIKVHGINHVSACKDFLGKNQIKKSLYKYLVSNYSYEPPNMFEACLEYFPEESLNQIIFLDALTGNQDRHFSNIEVISDYTEGDMLAPIFDNGASLLSWIDEDKISSPYIYNKEDKSKTFKRTHKLQIKLVKNNFFDKVNLTSMYADIINEIEPVLELLSNDRKNAIKNYLKYRMKYFKYVTKEVSE